MKKTSFTKAQIRQILLFVFTAALAVIAILPLLWILSTSFKSESEIITGGFHLLPKKFTLDTYNSILFDKTYASQVPVFRWFLNSLLVSSIHTVLMLLISSMSAYAYARMEFKGKKIMFYVLLSTMMVPQSVIIAPLYNIMVKLGWVNTYMSMIFPGLSSVFAVFLMRQFMLGIPKEYDEAANIDGAGRFLIFIKVILPLMKPSMVVTGLFVFLNNWNDFLWPTIITSSVNMRTLPAGLRVMQGFLTTQYGKIAAASVISALPVFVIYLFAQKYFQKGLSLSSGVKG